MAGTPDADARLRALKWTARAVSPFSSRDEIASRWPPDADWPLVIAAADQGFVLPSLKAALDRHGLAGRLPDELGSFLDMVFALHVERREALRRQMKAINRLLADAGIRPVWLKGAETLLDPDHAAGTRVMLDLDLWIIEPDAQQEALRLMAGAGWQVTPESDRKRGWAECHHYKPLQHDDWPAAVEVHRWPVARWQKDVLPYDATAATISWSTWDGGPFGLLDRQSALVLAIIQSTAMTSSDFALGRLKLMKSLDVVERLARDFGCADPPAIADRPQHPSIGARVRRLLSFAADFYGIEQPPRRDDAYLHAVIRNIRHPRLNALMGHGSDIVQRRLGGLAREPYRLPGILADMAARALGRR